MRVIRRTAQVLALVGTLMIGVVAAALIVSQTPWFKDWLRRYVMRESKQYLNGQLTIGRLNESDIPVTDSLTYILDGMEWRYPSRTFIVQGKDPLDEISHFRAEE